MELSSLTSSWLFMAFAAPMLWALVNVVDVYFCKEVYRDDYAATAISQIFQIIPWIAVPWIGFTLPETRLALLAISGGFLVSISYFFYYRSIFSAGDVTLIQTIWNGTSIVVPILAYFLLSERLGIVQYVGIVIVLIGATLLSLGGKIIKTRTNKIIGNMIFTTILFSFALVVEDRVYESVPFRDGLLLFMLGSFLAGVCFLVIHLISDYKTKLLKVRPNFFIWFAVVAIIDLLGMTAFQRAIDIAPSVSFVATIESFIPAFVMILSLIIVLFSFLIKSLRKREEIKKMCQDQFIGWKTKTIAIVVMAAGVYLINI